MSATLVPAVRTTYTQDQLIEAMVEAWVDTFGELPSKESVGVLYAQTSIETGGSVSMWNNNCGNTKYIASANHEDDNDKQYMMLDNVWEIIKGVKRIFNPPDPTTWFRAFPTLKDGWVYQLDFLKNHKYQACWSAVESGNVIQFAHLLKVGHYYTADETAYGNAMNGYFKKYMNSKMYENAITYLKQAPNANVVASALSLFKKLS